MEGTGHIDQMTTLSQVMTRLTQRGIHREFRMNEQCEMKLDNSEKTYQPDDLTIIKTYRFEGPSNPDDNAVLYVVRDKDANLGMVIDSYGAESNHPKEFDDFLRQVPILESNEFDFD